MKYRLRSVAGVFPYSVTSAASTITTAERRYYSRLTKQRLHLAAFRVNVLSAYREACTMCQLKHLELLDAAHIVSDALGGAPVRQGGR